jgi:hypothetical protein
MQPNRNRRIFIIVFFVFTAAAILLAIDMGRRTTAPWNKKKQILRAIPVEESDSVEVAK